MLRVISLFYLVQWNERAATSSIPIAGQGLIMLDVLVFWLLWIKRAARALAPRRHAQPGDAMSARPSC